ncbi:thiamine pyrophosphate-binding protein [Cryobacterium sp. Y50]|uniref:thiamine pyrophosphate-binding protein n=1 Tax=Cryobacterium sp. Y50 TaxID=2048286 RepID=UPI000CE2DC06|nr:thiamine pyrophosphate-dependent enzyme [Cryobacterium sp. Y50]
MTTRYGSSVIVDLMRQAGIRHVAFNPGASFRGIHDSLIHEPDAPELILCLHEAIAVGVAQGYVKALGEPMGVLLHDVVGLQNAAMSIYNAWRDRAPMLLFGGTGPKSLRTRRPWIDWIHTASVQGSAVRDFVVWDNEPHDLYSVPDSFVRGLRAATSTPGGPVYLCYDVDLQENLVPADFVDPMISEFDTPAPPAAARDTVRHIAALMREAKFPIILAGFAGESDENFAALAALADALGAAVIDTGVRHAFSTTHPLCATGMPEMLERADLVLALDVDNLPVSLQQTSATVINVTLSGMRLRGWAQDYQLLVRGETVAASADSVIAALLAELRAEPVSTAILTHRTKNVAAMVSDTRADWRSSAATSTREGLVPLDRLLYEVGEALRSDRYVLANGTNQRLEHRTWRLDQPRQYLGWHSGGGLGYGVPATIGASIALGPETIAVDIQADGDLLFLPSALWTAAKYSTPTLIVVNNNRQYGNTVEHATRIGANRDRVPTKRCVGAGLSEPAVDLRAMAASFGVWASGPISDVAHLRQELEAALRIVRSGKPALLDVLTPGF